jgi:hypothetical protein
MWLDEGLRCSRGGSVDVKKGTPGGSAEVSNYHLGMMQMTLLLEVSDGNVAMVCITLRFELGTLGENKVNKDRKNPLLFISNKIYRTE